MYPNMFRYNSKGKYSQVTLENMELNYYAPCPVKQCMTNDKNYRYVCKHCGGQLKLTYSACLRCEDCPFIKKFVDMKFACKNHNSVYPSIQGILRSLATMTKNSSEIEKLFISQVLVKISQGCKNNPNLVV